LTHPTIGTLVNPVDAFAGLSRIHPTKAADRTGKTVTSSRTGRSERSGRSPRRRPERYWTTFRSYSAGRGVSSEVSLSLRHRGTI